MSDYEDYRFKEAIDKLLYMMHNHFKHKVGLAIYIVSEESGFTTRELSHYLYKIKILKRDRCKVLNSDNYSKVYRG
jgi:hypothetical protein